MTRTASTPITLTLQRVAPSVETLLSFELEGSREDIRYDEIDIMIITNNCLFYYAVLFWSILVVSRVMDMIEARVLLYVYIYF